MACHAPKPCSSLRPTITCCEGLRAEGYRRIKAEMCTATWITTSEWTQVLVTDKEELFCDPSTPSYDDALGRSVRPEEAEAFAASHFKGDAEDGLDCAKSLDEGIKFKGKRRIGRQVGRADAIKPPMNRCDHRTPDGEAG